MSLVVILIAAAPAAAVAAVAIHTKRRSLTILSAIAAAGLGLATGSPAYAALDVGAVIIALALVWPNLKIEAAHRRIIRQATKAAKKQKSNLEKPSDIAFRERQTNPPKISSKESQKDNGRQPLPITARLTYINERNQPTEEQPLFETFEKAKEWAMQNPGRSFTRNPAGVGFIPSKPSK